MLQFAMAHPYLFTLIVLAVIQAAYGVIYSLINWSKD
jgi:hypothetical protein